MNRQNDASETDSDHAMQQCCMGQKRGLQRRDQTTGMRWTRCGCYCRCAERPAKARPGTNTSEEQREWHKLQKDHLGRRLNRYMGMWWGEVKNTMLGKVSRTYICEGKGREDEGVQDGNTRATETWKERRQGDGNCHLEREDHQSSRRLYVTGKPRGKAEYEVETNADTHATATRRLFVFNHVGTA